MFEAVARQLGKWLVPAAVIAALAALIVAHLFGAPCTPISVLYGLVEYTKGGQCPAMVAQERVNKIEAANAALRDRIRTSADLSGLPHLVADGIWFFRSYHLRRDPKTPQSAGACPASPCFRITLEGIIERHGTQVQDILVGAEPQPAGSRFRMCGKDKITSGEVDLAQFISNNPPTMRFSVPLVNETQRCWCVGNQELTLTVRDARINELVLDATIRRQDCSSDHTAG